MKRFYVILGVTLLVFIVTVAVYMRTRRHPLDMEAMEKGLSAMERVVLMYLPEAFPMDRTRSAFAYGREKLKTGEADLHAFEGLIATFQEAIEDETLDSLEVAKVLEALERL